MINNKKTYFGIFIVAVLLVLMIIVWNFFFAVKRYNVLFIAVDDMNDWVSILENYPGIHTPNIERLAKDGIVFREAHAASTVCNPSRFAVVSGLLPSSTGVYDRKTPTKYLVKKHRFKFLMDYFKEAGYYTVGIGKILHTGLDPLYKWDRYFQWKTREKMKRMNGINDCDEAFFDWGEFNGNENDIDDVKKVNHAKDFLRKKHNKPFFLAVGIHNPHLPWIVPKRFFDLYPIDKIQINDDKDDLADLSVSANDFIEPVDEKNFVNSNNKANAIQAYLAAVSFTDELLGRILDALEASEYADNTIIVFWSDHGLHLGEKKHWRKSTLWRNSSHVPFVISTPESRKKGQLIVEEPVSFVDILPTLLDLCHIKTKPERVDGHSLLPLMTEDSNKDWLYPAITVMRPNNYSIHYKSWHYIHYKNNDEELYDLSKDRHDRHNLAQDKNYEDVLARFRKFAPGTPYIPLSELPLDKLTDEQLDHRNNLDCLMANYFSYVNVYRLRACNYDRITQSTSFSHY